MSSDRINVILSDAAQLNCRRCIVKKLKESDRGSVRDRTGFSPILQRVKCTWLDLNASQITGLFFSPNKSTKEWDHLIVPMRQQQCYIKLLNHSLQSLQTSVPTPPPMLHAGLQERSDNAEFLPSRLCSWSYPDTIRLVLRASQTSRRSGRRGGVWGERRQEFTIWKCRRADLWASMMMVLWPAVCFMLGCVDL